MKSDSHFDVIIIGGSFSGLSAAMALGRALRHVLIIDSGKPCNRQTPHSHNFITQDGKTPQEISSVAKAQVMAYPTVKFFNGLAINGLKTDSGYKIETDDNRTFHAQKLIFASGVKDNMPDIKGFSDCWGISVIHCPYCHGYEVRKEKTGILANGDFAFHYAQLINHWTKDLTIFTNGKSTLTEAQTKQINSHNIKIIETEINSINHNNGYIDSLMFKDKSTVKLKALYARPNFEQHCKIPETLGCEITEQGFIKVDMMQKTTQKSIYACGDNASPMRSVAYAVAAGNVAGAVLNNEIIEAEFTAK
ncbi:pyridine nucleotide-disulfide oxidoreductase [Tamlana nanhaiensis]|uniref:Pyridine nucleotide-disulfide oxidoreductase n=1 Tax=Neotamlana nanhaiensis TaxID=1382798 RepID=A0A0D7W5H2_9FLAO|nr:NAD(P)/FAD-dependent oxidoreductase [Tamlana nanhaiensis]KJD34376.1 pyridine nucleotide-disulfide oxidoreductase [Tamlana nanhaiensis]